MAIDALERFVGHMTLRELAGNSGRSVGEIVEYAMRAGRRSAANGAPRKREQNERKPAQAKATKNDSVDTRSAAGRDQYDAAVLDELRDVGGKMGATDLRARIGGTALQIRTSLGRLIDAGEVAFEGKARATRYWVA